MAVELKKFQEEHKKIETAVVGAFGEWKAVGDSQGNIKTLLAGTRLGIGDRIGAMKAAGSQGAKLSDFEHDPEVKTALDNAKKALSNFKGIEARKKAVIETVKMVQKDLLDLAGRIDAELASRKKKMFEPKSLPDMIKLGKTVRDELDATGGIKSQSINEIAKVKLKDGEFESEFWTALDLEIKKSAAIRANAAVSELMEMFKPRVIKLRSDRVSGLAKEIESICTVAITAQKSGDLNSAETALRTAFPKCDEMHAIVEKFNHAFSSNKSFLEQNPDSQTIVAAVSFMAATENRVLKAVHSLQGAIH